MNRIAATCSRFYDTYLKGVPLKQFLGTLGLFYGLVVTILTTLGVPKQPIVYVAIGLTAVAGIIYLKIPKDKQPLFDNLVREAANDPALASKIVAAAVFLTPMNPNVKGVTNDAIGAKMP